ncbi:bifunctional diaminohydroxyphosphoribosylaminopyrimidine deaminase/5-amino-6-(5-phosphoribosylamino)uracil reductase RibD [Clostridium sporogenes]|uniref:bifunctional diaminohydroxyphosphoribosylaminopyrimidine deaminase/5-amino-6-(5-phosphoribosylamino)uracil reductase RibD n=1 Tax=Clostridium sporogenes TaxID=1509 RepID=UPI0013CFBBB5|nr:bifunctional diaminohydroxyphosphoribosylaminopyrimidine deaminase/5-amino-6-(5-phosphoribosylamino)uracil reductase RibD [Clostridium sporogenes]EJP6471090.1 bifunctional diaminohydroxyphosphoribosylaminopyrimidine deaminase/5-amino-6-(5-phosphoribosylamino)uracil reductase RibD [Clostridium botulinum]NFV12813.1 bifunctional diaminohydroxyphosphoribosylaminopyrimidine deaminase/5-amino-6-(5-phosphoribosylamino)uracil reductase RibD [Clostridium sporogenes]
MEDYDFYMKEALNLAEKGIGKVNPNPKVGAIVVKDNKIIGKGYHKYFGGPHAEVYALKEAGEKAKGATIYVTLEPCSHYGKTPPCAEAIVKAGISKAVISMKDPNPLVEGNGLDILKRNGIEVVTGIMEKESKELNEVFIKYITKKEPFVILKTASTLDGKIATKKGESKWITGEQSRYRVQEIRNDLSGIMVGIGTIIKDNPLLTTRIEGGRSPKAIIVDSHLRIPLESKILKTIDERTIYVFTTKKHNNISKKNMLEKLGVKVLEFQENEEGKVPLKEVIQYLGENGMDSILLEGGSTLNFSALKEGIIDKVMCFIAPKIMGGKDSKNMIGGNGVENLKDIFMLKNLKFEQVEQDILIEGYVDR